MKTVLGTQLHQSYIFSTRDVQNKGATRSNSEFSDIQGSMRHIILCSEWGGAASCNQQHSSYDSSLNGHIPMIAKAQDQTGTRQVPNISDV